MHANSPTDVLIHDAQYVEEELQGKRGWGHSTVTDTCELAADGVRHLVLYHHDRERTDAELDHVEELARNWLRARNHEIQCTVAYEGLTLEI
ncbi:MAG TPA: hypothetical protein VE398_01915 [Acidobacteriota bacterium]|nr:hypothetical protein [Acidobacteriota bacterium]